MNRRLTPKEMSALAAIGSAGTMHVGQLESKGWMSAAMALEDLGYIKIKRGWAELTRRGKKTV